MSDEQLRVNPYAASDAAMVNPADDVAVIPDGSGPPWEQPGPWPKRFFETMWLSYRSPGLLFREMRRQGSLWMPVGYVVAASTLFALTQGLMQYGTHSASMGLIVAKSWVLSLVNVPLVAILAAIIQLLLAITGRRHSFRATLRSAYYVAGSSLFIGLFGVIGQWLSMVVEVILQIIAIKAVHRISEVRAILVTLGAWLMLIVGVIAIVVAAEVLGIMPELN